MLFLEWYAVNFRNGKEMSDMGTVSFVLVILKTSKNAFILGCIMRAMQSILMAANPLLLR